MNLERIFLENILIRTPVGCTPGPVAPMPSLGLFCAAYPPSHMHTKSANKHTNRKLTLLN